MPSSAKRVLGRGLADLIPPGGNESVDGAGPPGREIPIAQIHRSPGQPRTHFDEDALAELTDSIRENGILQPILVRPRTVGGGFEIVAGERRYRAALRAGLKEIPAVVRELSDADTFALALIENLIREDIGPLETALAFHKLMEEYGWTQEEMGRRVGKSRSAVANSLRLLTLPAPIRKSLETGEISEGHARSLVGDDKDRQHPDFGERQLAIWRQVKDRALSVRDAERMMRDSKSSASSTESTRSRPLSAPAISDSRETQEPTPQEIRAIEDRLRTALGTRVKIAGSGSRGRIEIEFFSPDELDALLTRFEAS